MHPEGFIPLLKKHLPSPPDWDDVIVGFDLRLLEPSEIVLWARGRTANSEPMEQLAANDPEAPPPDTIPLLWAACEAETGKTPRHGSHRWLQAHDRWRVALLKEVMETTRTPESLAIAVQVVNDMLGFPEDMFGLWRNTHMAPFSLPQSDFSLVQAHVAAIEERWRDTSPMRHVS